MIRKLLLTTGIVCLGLYVTFTVQSWWHQEQLTREFEELESFRPAVPAERNPPGPELAEPKAPSEPARGAATPGPRKAPKPVRKLREGDLVGRLEIPGLNVSVMVMEGTASKTLRLGAGRISGTARPGTPGNMGIAAHRDTFFRPLSRIKKNDTIKFTTKDNGTEVYKVVSTQIVTPSDVHVLDPTSKDMITLVTCYPFRYVGPAPNRFIVKATKTQ